MKSKAGKFQQTFDKTVAYYFSDGTSTLVVAQAIYSTPEAARAEFARYLAVEPETLPLVQIVANTVRWQFSYDEDEREFRWGWVLSATGRGAQPVWVYEAHRADVTA